MIAAAEMAALRMKPEYGPTLGRLLAPRWHAASRLRRAAVLVAGVALVAVLMGAFLTLENAELLARRPGAVQLQLPRPVPDGAGPGGFVKIQSRWRGGALKYSYAVGPLRLPRYTGEAVGCAGAICELATSAG